MSLKDIDPDNIPEKDNDESLFPEHVPLIPLNIQREKEKEELRKKAKELRKKIGKIEPIIVTKDGTAKKASELLKSEQEYEIVRCGINPVYFIETYLTIFDQTRGVAGLIVPFILFDFQVKLIKTYMENRFVVAGLMLQV